MNSAGSPQGAQSPAPALAPGPEIALFATALDDCLRVKGSVSERRSRLLKLVDSYHQYAAEQYQILQQGRGAGPRRALSSGLHDDMDLDLDDGEEASNLNQGSSKLSPEAIAWRQEAQTWDLLRRLLASRYADRKGANRSGRFSPRGTVKGLWQEFVESDSAIVERKAVLHWLQSNAFDGPNIDELVKELQQNADRGDIVAHGWIHTRTAIKQRKRLLGSPHPLDASLPEVAQGHLNSLKAPLVTNLDPDATTRQGRKLQPQDEYFERATWLGCYELLRRGYSAEAIREWCVERTEGWRAVSLSALPLAPRDDGPSPETTPEALALWRRTCLAIARQPDVDDYERAVYGMLGGDVATVERVSSTWDDFVFAHYNAIVRSQFDSFILSKCAPEEAASLSQSFISFDAAQKGGEPAALEKRLLKALEQSNSTMSEAREPYKVFQAAVLANELEQYFFDQGLVLGQQANKEVESRLIPTLGFSSSNIDSGRFYTLENHHGLRVIAHAYIIMSQLEKLSPDSTTAAVSSDASRALIQQNSVSGYISLLRLCDAPELIPLYSSTLGETRQYETLCRNLIHVTDDVVRLRCINLIGKSGLDALKFVQDLASMHLRAVLAQDGSRPAAKQFRILEDGPANIKYGRPVKADFFGDDPDRIGKPHELLIRSVEWLTLVGDAWPDVLSIATETYKHFLQHLHLNAARQFSQRVLFVDVLRERGFELEEELEGLEPPGPDFWVNQLSLVKSPESSAAQIAADARSFRDLECLVRALDHMETLASLEELSREEPAVKREFWAKVADEVKAVKEHMSPIMDGWLLEGIQGMDFSLVSRIETWSERGGADLVENGRDTEFLGLRQTYLPEVVLAYISTLHFAGTCLSRDNLLECMDLAAVIAQKDSDIAACFVEVGRMKELVEAFASCSKALAVMTGEKKAAGSSSKKLREMGWSRDLWSVKSGESGR